jgi:hypothetical protein
MLPPPLVVMPASRDIKAIIQLGRPTTFTPSSVSLPGSGHLRIHQAPQQDLQDSCAGIYSQSENQISLFWQREQAIPIILSAPIPTLVHSQSLIEANLTRQGL